MKYAEVILPLPLKDAYTYLVPDEMETLVQPHFRVIVPFGNKHYYTAVVKEVHERKPEAAPVLKAIFSVPDTTPAVRSRQVVFWEWMASYYLCKLGDVYKAALPAGLKLESKTTVAYCKDFEAPRPLSAKEQSVLDAFSNTDRLTVAELEKLTGFRHLIPLLTALTAQGAVTVSEEIGRGWVPKTETYLRLAPDYCTEESLQPVFAQLRRAKQQEKLFLAYLHLTQPFSPVASTELSKKKLLHETGLNASALDGLLKRGVLVRYEKAIPRYPSSPDGLPSLNPLTEAQQTAYHEIQTAFAAKPVCLLHGVPSCGKTEIYLHQAIETLRQGRQVLYLLPDIAVTERLTERLAGVIGDKLRVYHSGCSDRERMEVWNNLLQSPEPVLILGVRSSLFLPFADLGLIIVDEEQEPSYTQQDPAPRYHARNAAVMLASLHGAKTLLGSAAPSLDSFYNAQSGKYGYVVLKTPCGESTMPHIHPVDTKDLKRRKIMKDALFSPLLKEKMDDALKRGEQVILFQNRRGFAPMMECKCCNRIPHCIRCHVNLTWHKQQHRLVCHYCGYSIPFPSRCPSCGSEEMKQIGFGTEKIEEEIAELFPGVKAGRLDWDTARTPTAYKRILTDFEQGKTSILIGTQMLSKGLDSGRVTVVGILNVDNLMNLPDFRACERTFQFVMQLSSLAGGRQKQGTVILQTAQPEHPLLQMIRTFDYEAMAYAQLSERQMFRYPPSFRLITVVLRSRDATVLESLSTLYADLLRKDLGHRVSAPFAPPVNKIQTLYLRRIVLKLERTMNAVQVRDLLEKNSRILSAVPDFKRVGMYYEVD